MNPAKRRDLIGKLFTHAAGAERLGNHAEAAEFKAKAYGLTQKVLAPPETRRSRKRRAVLQALVRKIHAAHLACVQAEADALRYAIRAGKLLIKVKEEVGHGNFLPWIRQHCRFSYSTALDYKMIAEWCEANPQRAQHLTSLRMVLAAIREDRADKHRTVKLVLTAAEWDRYWGLLEELDAQGEPVPMILQALAYLAGHR